MIPAGGSTSAFISIISCGMGGLSMMDIFSNYPAWENRRGCVERSALPSRAYLIIVTLCQWWHLMAGLSPQVFFLERTESNLHYLHLISALLWRSGRPFCAARLMCRWFVLPFCSSETCWGWSSCLKQSIIDTRFLVLSSIRSEEPNLNSFSRHSGEFTKSLSGSQSNPN